MNNVERHQYILKQLQAQGHVLVVELCQELQVSSVTIRKDLQFLENARLLYRTHGGATRLNPYQTDRSISEKEKLHVEEKSRIGSRAAMLVEENDSIIIASGTTMQYFARAIQPVGQLTVITSALNVTYELMKHDTVDIIQLGGSVRRSSSSITGRYAEDLLADFYCSKLFLGVDGLDMSFGLTTTSAQEAVLNRKMAMAAQKVVVLADSSKFGRKSLGKIMDCSNVDIIVTNEMPINFQRYFESLGIEVIIC